MDLKCLAHPVFQALHDAGIDFAVEKDCVRIDGFYKSGCCRLAFVGASLVAYTRYDQQDVIGSFDRLVELNYTWWRRRSSDKPDDKWSKHFERLGLDTQPTNPWRLDDMLP